jgi:hypothetical protein
MRAHSTASTAGRSSDPGPRLVWHAEVGGLGQPGREVARLGLTGFTQRHALELAQGLGGRHGSGGLEFVHRDLAREEAGEE